MDIHTIYSKEVAKGTGASATVDESEYLIPEGKSLAIEAFEGGHEYSINEVRIEIIERTDSGGDILINCGYGSDFHKHVGRGYSAGDNRKIVVRFINGSPHALHMSASWYGRLYDNG